MNRYSYPSFKRPAQNYWEPISGCLYKLKSIYSDVAVIKTPEGLWDIEWPDGNKILWDDHYAAPPFDTETIEKLLVHE